MNGGMASTVAIEPPTHRRDRDKIRVLTATLQTYTAKVSFKTRTVISAFGHVVAASACLLFHILLPQQVLCRSEE